MKLEETEGILATVASIVGKERLMPYYQDKFRADEDKAKQNAECPEVDLGHHSVRLGECAKGEFDTVVPDSSCPSGKRKLKIIVKGYNVMDFDLVLLVCKNTIQIKNRKFSVEWFTEFQVGDCVPIKEKNFKEF